MSRIDVDALADEWDDDGSSARPRGRPDASVAARHRRDAAPEGRVVAVDRARIDVLLDGTVVPARYGGAMRGTRVVVGDRVRVDPARHDGDEPRVVGRSERTTVLSRTGDDLDDQERVIVANADAVACVVGADHLDLGLRFADRVLVAASVGGLESVLVVNKVDLADRASVEAAIVPYRPAVARVCVVSARTGDGLDELSDALEGRWTAFTGHSGVGKSSLFNRLVPGADRAVGELGTRGGRHTSVSAIALALPGGRGWLVDTPGVRSFGLGTVTSRDLWRHVPELAGLDCALDDCAHDGEPGCTVDGAAIHPVRLAAYRRLLAALREDA